MVGEQRGPVSGPEPRGVVMTKARSGLPTVPPSNDLSPSLRLTFTTAACLVKAIRVRQTRRRFWLDLPVTPTVPSLPGKR
jgi:hypothetical protein